MKPSETTSKMTPQQRYYYAHREKCKALMREYYHKTKKYHYNPEKAKAYYEKNKEAKRAYQREWVEKNKEKVKEYQKKYREL